ncbi:MAG: choice-of-anchor L domain-containing protein [Thermoanaerobaculia bacterium]
MKRLAYLIAVAMLASPVQAAITTTDLSQTTPEALGALLTGPGIEIFNIKFTGAESAAGSFTGGTAAGLGINSGVILSSGEIADVVGPNDSTGASTGLGKPGDADLEALIPGFDTNDATILEFDFIAESENFAIQYVFGSEEYKEFVGSPFNDVFGFFLDGANIAFVAGSTSQLVSVNSINHASNAQFYVDNPTEAPVFNTELDGFTVTLIASAIVTPGVQHHIKLAIADASDSALDSVVVLAAGGITGAPLLTLQATPFQNFVDVGGTTSFNVQGFGFAPDVRFTLSAENVPAGVTVTFSPAQIDKENTRSSTATVTVAPTVFPKPHVIEIVGTPDDPEVRTARGVVLLDVGCTPPMILAINQPASQTVLPGETATIKVTATGSSPFTFQWFEGPRGSTWFPIANATTDTFTSPAIFGVRQFWVRVENGCGSVDSATARLANTSSRTRPPVGGTSVGSGSVVFVPPDRQ